jgi:dynamin 1-like protein
MDEGTDALELLQGKIYALKLGYFGVKCRSQK